MRTLRRYDNRSRMWITRILSVAVVATLVPVINVLVGGPAAAAGPCDFPVVNKIACENDRDGSPDWMVDALDSSILGFTTDISYAPGNTVNFKVKTDASSYRVDIFRLGYYRGVGAHLKASVSRNFPQAQPPCIENDRDENDRVTGLIDCGNWAVSVSWNIPTNAVSGIYYAVLHRNDNDAESEVVFVVRDDASRSDILFQTSDSTWQAYNTYGNGPNTEGNSLYTGTADGSGGSAYKVSYNRPLSGGEAQSFIFNAEYPMLKFLEANGYDISYTTDVDTARRGDLIRNHKVFMPVGHDEYWSNEQRNNVEAARAAGVNMAFLTGNEIFWKTRWENSIDSSHTSWRTLVCYKETKGGQKKDPSPQWTGTWRDPRLSPPADGGRPENALLGQIFTVNGYREDALSVPPAYGKMRLWRNTPLATDAAANKGTTFKPGTLGYEWDSVEDNGFQPPGIAQLSRTQVTMDGPFILKNYGDEYGSGTKTHALTLYRHQPGGALVFAAGTVQWAWGVENEHLPPQSGSAELTADISMKQATVNLLADMGAQPATRQTELVAATKSTDTTPPVATFGITLAATVGTPYTFSGSVTDVVGKVAGVEVSVDGGATWHAANWEVGTATWSYTFTPANSGQRTLQVRAVDDSANLSAPVDRIMTVDPRPCPCSIWTESTVPTTVAADDTTALELGVKFQTNADGYIRGVKFYKGPGNTGTHTGSLWTTSGTRLATGTFTGESLQGWQTLTFPTAVPIAANTTYIASYHTNTGHYSADSNYFSPSSNGLEPLTALQGTTANPNGVFRIGASGFPDRSFQNTNYWVDVVYGYDPGPDIRSPLILTTNPIDNQSSVSLTVTPSVTFDEPIAPTSLQFTVSGPAGNVPGTVSLSSDDTVATFRPNQALAPGTTYTMSLRASDLAGNSIANPPVTWPFTTGSPRPASCPCTIWDDFATPTVPAVNDQAAVEVGTKIRFDGRGSVQGIRFYKGPDNTGTHTGSLWTVTGTRLATGTFTGESGAGWQTLMFSTPVDIQPNTTYVVSYYAPNGSYSASSGYFSNSADYGAMHALADGVVGGNGVYRYGVGGGFPTSSYNASSYWVDVIWQPGRNGDTTPPVVVSSTPAPGTTGVPLTAPVTATFTEPVDLSTAQFSLIDPGGAKLAGSVSLSTDLKTVSWTPSADWLPARDTRRVPGSPTSTATCGRAGDVVVHDHRDTDLPVLAVQRGHGADRARGERHRGDTSSVFGSAPPANGLVTGVKFYQGRRNTGTHTGSLWTAAGSCSRPARLPGRRAPVGRL